ncbi:hypothetical protein [Sulfurimonas sp. HSL-1716]|uniref:hypothetical protein n=1 Tax=Hydrocurvibacter sulfurireducens TaxID=3131937 RepID=UPI0031F76840
MKNEKYDKQTFRAEFFLYILNELNHSYENNLTKDTFGITSKESLGVINNLFQNKTKKEKISFLTTFNLAKKDKTDEEKKIFSLFKTVGYYIKLSAIFDLIYKDSLTDLGLELASYPSKKDFTNLSSKQKSFFFNRIIEKDLLFILPLIFWRTILIKHPKIVSGYGDKAKYENSIKFISEALSHKKFVYTAISWNNYIVVRNQWLKDIDCIGSNGNIKPSFKLKLLDTEESKNYYNQVALQAKQYIKTKVTPLEKYLESLKTINKTYKQLVKEQDRKNYAFINLYDIAQEAKFSYNKMQDFLNHLVLDKENWQRVKLNNVIGGADSRKRFFIRRKPILNIKILEDLK